MDIFAIALQLTPISIFSAYDPLHKLDNAQVNLEVLPSPSLFDPLLLKTNQNSLDFAFIRLPELVHNPSPALFAASGMLYTASALTFYHLHENDQYQKQVVTVGVGLGILVPAISTGLDTIRVYLPIFTTVAMALSAVGHMAWRTRVVREDTAISEEKVDTGIQRS